MWLVYTSQKCRIFNQMCCILPVARLVSAHCIQFFVHNISYEEIVSLSPTQITTSKLNVVWLVCILKFVFFEVT